MKNTITPVHIQLKKGDISERVLIAGDPSRIENLSKLLKDPKVLNTYRYLIYIGEYKGKKITLASHGIGAPSMVIAVEELHALGGQEFIRLGTCGGIKPDQKPGDLVIPTAAYSAGGGTIGAYVKNSKSNFKPDAKLTSTLLENVEKQKKIYRAGLVFSSDAFYREKAQIKKMDGKLVGVEMECAALFMLGALEKFKTASLLLVVDNPLCEVPFLSVEEMHRQANEAAATVLDTLVEN